MRVRLRQVALVARDLAPVEAAIEAALGVVACYRDPGVATFGLENVLYPIGDKLLEVVSSLGPGTTAGRLLDKRGGDGGYMVLIQVDDLDEMRRRFAAAGARVVYEAVTDGITGLHLHPRDLGGAIVSVDETDEWARWPWAGPEWRTDRGGAVVSDLVGVAVEAHDPGAMAARWAEVLGGDLASPTTLRFDEGEVNFVQAAGRGEGIGGVDLAGTAAESRAVEICGTRVTINAAGGGAIRRRGW